MQPCDARLLVRPQCCIERRSRVGSGLDARLAQGCQRLGEPGAGDRLPPIARAVLGLRIPADPGPGQQPHSLAERKAIIGSAALDLLELRKRAG